VGHQGMIGDVKPLIIAEVAQAHDGSLGIAHSYIDAVAKVGCDAVKFQTHIAGEESSPEEPWRVNFSYQDKTRMDYWRRMEFSPEEWAGLKTHAEDKGLFFISSPFSLAAVDLLKSIGVKAWKVASGETSNLRLIEKMAETKLPVLLSSGMSSYNELDLAVEMVKNMGAPLGVFQCSSKYPTPPSEIGLNILRELTDRYSCPVGLSDHSGKIFAPLAAISRGAHFVEVHVTFHEDMFGPDTVASLTIAELEQLVAGARFIAKALSSPVKKDEIEQDFDSMRGMFQQGLVAANDIAEGEELTRENLTFRKPCKGIPAKEFFEVIGSRASCPIRKGEFIHQNQVIQR